MPMNSFTFKRGSGGLKDQDEEQTATGYEITTTGSTSKEEVTEITVRIRPVDLKEVSDDQDFDINKVRGSDIHAVEVETLAKDYKDPKGVRKSPRYAKALTTVIYTSKNSFRTTTINISVGGALLADELPSDFMKGPLEILFIHEEENKKQYFMFQGEAVIGHKSHARIQFKTASTSAQETLTSLLARLGPKALVA